MNYLLVWKTEMGVGNHTLPIWRLMIRPPIREEEQMAKHRELSLNCAMVTDDS